MAHFKTAHSQKILPLDVKVTAELVVGDLVVFTAGTPASIAKASSLAAATHMVALSDETVGGNFVPTDMKNYAPSNKVAASTTAKKVGLYPLFDKADVIED